MDLHKLKGFHAVARYGGFTAAARRLRRTQPTLSLQVKTLETELGTQLLERRARGVKLTPEGQVLYDMATRLFDTESQIDAVFSDHVRFRPSQLAVATNQSIAAHILPTRLEVFTNRFPKVEVNIHNMRTADILAAVKDDSIDVGIILIDPLDPELVARSVLPYEMVLVTPRDHPLSRKKSVSLNDIAKFPFISYTKDTETRQLIDQPFESVRQNVSVRMALGSTDLIIAYVGLGYGISIIHNLNLDEADRVHLHVRPLKRFYRRQYIHLVYRSDEILSSVARGFIDLF